MTHCLFVSDLHGHPDRYEKLWRSMREFAPDAVFLGGDLFPSGLSGAASSASLHGDFVRGYLAAGFERVRSALEARYPAVFLIMGNDDSRQDEAALRDAADTGLWTYVHDRCCRFRSYEICGYACVPPTPFLNKDWERYDVSRYVPPGGVSPEQGYRSIAYPANTIRYATIQKDLDALAGQRALDRTIFLFHSPPFETCLDRAANDGRTIDAVPLDLHVGSIAIRRFLLARQPLVSLHGHVHESARLSGDWRDRLGRTHMFSAAHDGPELALIRFDPDDLAGAIRTLR